MNMSASMPTIGRKFFLPWAFLLFLAACGQRLPVGQPPAQTVAANPDIAVLQSGDLAPTRSHVWGTWGGQAVRDAAVGYFGQPAQTAPLPAQTIPAHPYLAAQGQNGMHGDSYAGKVQDWPAPLGRHPQVRSKSLSTLFGGECATVSFDAKGRVRAVCATLLSFRLYLLDAQTLSVLAYYELPLRASNKSLRMRRIMEDTSGGAYHHVLAGDRPLIVDAHNVLGIYAVDDSGAAPVWQRQQHWDLQPALPSGHKVTDAMPDWQGQYWFVTRQGLVGVLHPQTGRIHTLQLPGEEIQNSFSVAQDGVYIVSDRALYRVAQDAAGQPVWTWREVYANDRQPKPGVIGLGSGTTPTLLGSDFVAITDNASPQIRVTVYRRQPDWAGQRMVCQVPVFTPGRSVTDNGMIGYGRSLIVTNNYGYDSPTRPVWTEGGVTRIDINPQGDGCSVVWHSPEAAQSVVPKMSSQTGLVYLYTREPVPGFAPSNSAASAWYLTALDYRSGQTRFKVLTGTGLNYNNNWAPITLSPWGTAYVGVLGGLVAVKDGPNAQPMPVAPPK
jgi:hypothetical protein